MLNFTAVRYPNRIVSDADLILAASHAAYIVGDHCNAPRLLEALREIVFILNQIAEGDTCLVGLPIDQCPDYTIAREVILLTPSYLINLMALYVRRSQVLQSL